MTRSWRRVAALLLIGVFLQPGVGAWAQDAAAYYRGKVVRLIVGYAPGGGYDSYARLVAPYLESRLGATVIVENQPGGGGFNALANLMREPGDGSRILLLNAEAALLSTLINEGSRRFDLRNLAYLGRVSYENRVLVARAGTPYARFDGFLKSAKPVFFGAGGRIDGMGDMASLLCDALAIACKLVTGFQGAPDTALALERGEVDALVTSESQTAHLITRRTLAAVAILSPNRAPLLPQVSPVFELAKLPPEKAKWLLFRAKISDLGRTLVLPSGTPADRIAVLEKAAAAVLSDPRVQDEGARTDRPIAYASAAETRRILDSIVTDLSDADRATIRRLLLSGY